MLQYQCRSTNAVKYIDLKKNGTPLRMWRRTLIHTYLAHQLTKWKLVNISWSHVRKGISAVEDSTAANVQENQRSQGRTLQIVLA
jgi:hypothetical protein